MELEFDNVAIVKRMREVCKVDTDKALGEILGEIPSKVSSWKVIKSPPYAACFMLSLKFGVSMEWLLLGEQGANSKEANSQSNGSQVADNAPHMPNELVDKLQFANAFIALLRHAENVDTMTISNDVTDAELKRLGLTLYNKLFQYDADISPI